MGHRYPTHFATSTFNSGRKVARAHVAVPEAAGVHWKTFSGVVPVLPQLLASRLVPLIVPLKVPPCAGMTVGLVQVPARTAGASGPWQTVRPSLLHRLSVCLLQARWWPPAATHAAISSTHAPALPGQRLASAAVR